MNTRSNGFSVLGILAIAGAVILLGACIWLAWRANQPRSEEELLPVRDGKIAEDPGQDINAGFVVVKEWGVRFKPQEGLGDVIYHLGVQQGFEGENATFSTKELAAYGDECAGKQNGKTPLGMLLRTSQQYSQFIIGDGNLSRQIGGYYYTYIPPQSACGSQKSAADDLQTKLLNQYFKPSIQTLEAAAAD